MSIGGNVEEEEHAITRKIERSRALNLRANVRVAERPGHMCGPKQLGLTKKNAPFLHKINMAQFGAPRSAVDKCFSRGSVDLENDWLWEEFMQLSADVFKP